MTNGSTNFIRGNYVLKRITQDEDGRLKSHENYVILHENQTYTRNPNLKVNIFDQKLSDEMLSLKQNIYGREQPTKLQSIKNNIATPTIDINQKWPAVSLLSKTREIEEHDYNADELDFRHLFPKQEEDPPMSTIMPNDVASPVDAEEKHNQLQEKVINLDDIQEQRNQSKDKIFDLRSLADHTPYNKNILRQNVHPVTCGCTRGNVDSNWTPGSEAFHYPFADTTNKKCGSCGVKTSISYTLMPYYVPYNPYMYYPPYVITEDSRVTDEIDNDSDKEESDAESDDEYYDEIKKPKKKKKKKKSKCKDKVIIDIDYDDRPREPEIKWDTLFFEGHPNKLVNNLVDDLLALYQDSTIKKCYCSSCSNLHCVLLSHIVLLIFMILL